MKRIFRSKVLFVTLFAFFATFVLATGFNADGLPIYQGGARATNGESHSDALSDWVGRNGRRSQLTFVKVTDDRGGAPTYWRVSHNGSFFDKDKVTEQDHKDSIHMATFQQYEEMFPQMYYFAIGHWAGRGISIQGTIITATNRYSATRYTKSTVTGKVTVEEYLP